MADWLRDRPFAHRGLHGPDTGPENSLAVFEAAVARGYGIECDLRLLADGEVAVFHDRELFRLTGRPGELARLTARDLETLRICGTDQRPPLFRRVLSLVAGRVPLYLELKSVGQPGPLVRAVYKRLAGYVGPHCLASFDPRTLALAARLDPNRIRCLIGSDWADPAGSWLKRFIRRHLFQALPARPHCIAYDLRGLPNASLAVLRRLGLPVLVWTVRSREDMDKALRYGDNIVFEGFLPPSPGNT
jgi:glycerophosphoryl diester phosphodiesterase